MTSSLASLFKQVSQPTPAEIDPEDAYHSVDAKTKATCEPDGELVHVMGTSKLREALAAGPDSEGKYAGRRVTVDQWMNGEQETCDKEDKDGEEEATRSDGQEDPSSQSSDGEEGHPPSTDGDSTHSSTSNDEHDEEAYPLDQPSASARAATPSGRVEEPSQLIKQLQASVRADIAKGQAVKEQLALYDRLLAVRIGMQKTLVATNDWVELGSAERSAVPDQRRMVCEGLLKLSSKIGTWRTALMESLSDERPRKRKEREENEDPKLEDCLEEADHLDEILAPYLRTTTRKWSAKINSASALNSAHQKKFDGGRQNAMDQLEQIWSLKEERQKLIERSQIKRAPRSETATALTSKNPLIFDDRDFYHSLLKEAVDTTTRNQDFAEGLVNDHRARRTHRENVDPRASKGRKIRYGVHEKLVSVMVPTPNELWTDEQKDELFGSLFGAGFEDEGAIPRNGLKLFG